MKFLPKKFGRLLLVVALCSAIVFVIAPKQGALFLGEALNAVDQNVQQIQENLSNIFARLTGTSKKITVDSDITLITGGDVNNNGDIDAGDSIRFSYTITNPTKNEYPFATLETHIPRNNLNFIHNVYGAASLSDENGTITIPNLRIPPQGEVLIRFNARVNYSSDEVSLSTEPELFTEDKKSLAKGDKKDKKAKPWKDEIPNMVSVKEK